MSNVKASHSKRSKRTLNILEQIVRDQVLADEEKGETAESKTKKTSDKDKKMKPNGDVNQNGFEERGRERTRKSKNDKKEKELSQNFYKSISVPKASSQNRSRSNSGSSSFWSNGKDSKEPIRSRSRSKSPEEPSQSTTKSLPVRSMKAKDKDTMSDIGGGSSKKKPPSGQKKGKLLKRKQIRKFKSMEINPDIFIEERLQQKYRELEEIMKGKTVKTNTITRQYIGQMETLREQYHMVSHGLAPPGVILPRSMSQELRIKGHLDQSSHGKRRPLSGGSFNSEQLSNKSTDMAYRSMQNIIHNSQNPHHEYPPSKPRKRKSKRKNSESTIDNSSFHSQTTATTLKTDHSTPLSTPRTLQEQEQLNYHIKYSSKEELREWLKKKDKLHRKKVKEEKAKKRAEREKMVLEANEKFEKRMEAQKVYKKWAEQKNKEISEMKRQERREHKRILKEYEEKNEKKNIRPESAPLKRRETSTGGVKVEGTTETNVNLREKSKKSGNESTLTTTPHPPSSKFIYKRPVAGRIKLAVNGKNPDSQKTDRERPKTASSSRSRSAEGNRMSYDQWVTQKRKQDQKKKELEELQKKEQMSKSDPDLNKIIPDIAKKRVHNVLEGKKRIDTGVKRIDDKLNKKFGGGDFKSEEQEKEADEQVRYSYRLESDRSTTPSTSGQMNVSGTAIKRPPSGARRPQTAPAGRVPPPKKSSGSPRQAVVPKLEDVMNEENTSNPFQLPFPPEAGVPNHVASRQRKLFAEQVWERLESEERPEPQGSDVPDPATCVSMTSPPASDAGDKPEPAREKDGTDSNELKSEEREEKDDVDSEKDLVFMTQFSSVDNLNKIVNDNSEANQKTEDVEATPEIEKLDLDFTKDSQKDNVSDQEENSNEADGDKTENKNLPKVDEKGEDDSSEEAKDSVADDNKTSETKSEKETDETKGEKEETKGEKEETKGEKDEEAVSSETIENDTESSQNVDILTLDVENTTRSSKRVSFNEAPEVFQTEEWSTDTQTPDEESFRSGLDDPANSGEKDLITSSLDDDF
uniref:Uncharacterized protein n=1 Tax=Magallana gigas TaxID=29159 RepID=A0A8W8NFQ9_MAGGI